MPTVVKEPETNRFDLRKSDFFLVENHLKIYEVMSTFGTILGKPMELLSHLIGQFHERHRPKRREAQSIEYPGSIFRNQHVGLFSISYFVMPDLQRHGDPGFAVIGKLYLERLHDIGTGYVLRRRLATPHKPTRESMPSLVQSPFERIRKLLNPR